jgi:hypothetical protein
MNLPAKFVKQLHTDILNFEKSEVRDPFALPTNAIRVQSIDVFVREHSAEFAPVRTGILIL